MKNWFQIIRKVKQIIESIFYYCASLFVVRNKQYIAFGSWGGNYYSDNSRYLAEYIAKENAKLHLFWIGNKTCKTYVEESGLKITFLEKDSFKANLLLLRCKYMFCTQMHFADLSSNNVFRKACICYLHHGMPIKKWGDDGLNSEFSNNPSLKHKILLNVLGRNIEYDYFVTSSREHDITNTTSLKRYGCCLEKNIHSGTPRNDMLVNFDVELAKRMKKKYCEILGIPEESRIVMYLPTFRRTKSTEFSFMNLEEEQLERLENLLSKYNTYIIEKSHFANKVSDENITEQKYCRYADKNVILQEMLLFTDCVISDYSGAFLDFILLDRPVIHFAYDYEFYRDVDSGLYYDIEDFSAGAVVKDFGELLDELGNVLEGDDYFSEKRKYVRKKYMGYETGNASEIIYKKVIKEK